MDFYYETYDYFDNWETNCQRSDPNPRCTSEPLSSDRYSDILEGLSFAEKKSASKEIDDYLLTVNIDDYDTNGYHILLDCDRIIDLSPELFPRS